LTAVSLARSGQETRVGRGCELFTQRGLEFRHECGAWMVPSATDADTVYAVRLGPVPSCECADHTYRGSHCLHITAATIAQAKSRTCSCCGSRVLSRFSTEVHEEHELLAWFPGDVLCADCIRRGFWA
jgi:hypothetical protein